MDYLFATEELPELRTRFAASVDKETIISCLHESKFMISLSPVARLVGPAENPSAWIQAEAKALKDSTPDCSEPEILAMKETISAWLPEASYFTAYVHHSGGSNVVVDAPALTKVWIRYTVEPGKDGGWELVEHGKMRALRFGIGAAKQSYMDSHSQLYAKLKESLDGGAGPIPKPRGAAAVH